MHNYVDTNNNFYAFILNHLLYSQRTSRWNNIILEKLIFILRTCNPNPIILKKLLWVSIWLKYTIFLCIFFSKQCKKDFERFIFICIIVHHFTSLHLFWNALILLFSIIFSFWFFFFCCAHFYTKPSIAILKYSITANIFIYILIYIYIFIYIVIRKQKPCFVTNHENKVFYYEFWCKSMIFQ